MSQDRPNLLYIHSDQHNPAVTGCYGDPFVQTPNLDHLAAKGVQFNNCYCPSPICVPSRMSMLLHYWYVLAYGFRHNQPNPKPGFSD